MRLEPVEAYRTIATIDVGLAPGWGCDEPTALLVGAWAGELGGDPMARLSAVDMATCKVEDMGGGYALARAPLPEPVDVPAGEPAWLVMGLAGGECTAKAKGPAEGSAWRWADGAWTEVDGRLVMGAEGCAVE